LCGHTSFNRLNLLSQKLAPVQITGLGYPPTTGLGSIDAKIMDPHVVGPCPQKFYAERPLVLPTSFWCFDPMEEAPLADEPPGPGKGFITFACVGNIAKISRTLLSYWDQILRRVPRSRLLVRSISFLDAESKLHFASQMRSAKLPMERVDFAGPVGGIDLFKAYNDVDIVLDTFPFNGGTTTAFALYMGVPVISLVGDALPSRMGLSMLANVGQPDWAVKTGAEYVRQAVALSQDVPLLRRFKREARSRMKACALGDGQQFAAEFEAACTALVTRINNDDPNSSGASEYPAPAVRPIAANEVARRAFAALRYGDIESAERIARYCVLHYPNHAGAHIVLIQGLVTQRRFAEAARTLEPHLRNASASDRLALHINRARLWLLAEDPTSAQAELDAAKTCLPSGDDIDQAQHRMLSCAAQGGTAAEDDRGAAKTKADLAPVPTTRLRILFSNCEDAQLHAARSALEDSVDVPAGLALRFEAIDAEGRADRLRTLLATGDDDLLLILQVNVALLARDFLARIVAALDVADLVSYAGATAWEQLEWHQQAPEMLQGQWVSPSTDRPEWFEANAFGSLAQSSRQAPRLAVLAGEVLAVRCREVARIKLRDKWVGAPGLLEQGWAFDAARAGLRLAAVNGLGVCVASETGLDVRYAIEARVQAVRDLGFKVFEAEAATHAIVQAPANSARAAFEVLCRYNAETSTACTSSAASCGV
jgi:protein O-GlcNAc transferase